MAAMIPSSPAVAAVLGLGTAVGVLLAIRGWRGGPQRRPRRPPADPRRARRCALAAVVGGVVGLLTGWVVGALLAGLACWSLPRALGRDPGHTRRVERIEAIASWAEMLRDTLSAAAGLEQAILATAPLAPSPIREDVGELAAGIRTGERLEPALRRLADRWEDPVGDLVVAALLLAARQQTLQLAELLGSLADAARSQATMRMRVEAGRSRTRTSVRVIVGTTATFAAAVVVLNRDYLAAFDGITGQLVLLMIGGLFAAGFAWLARIARIAEPERFLSATTALSAGGQQ